MKEPEKLWSYWLHNPLSLLSLDDITDDMSPQDIFDHEIFISMNWVFFLAIIFMILAAIYLLIRGY